MENTTKIVLAWELFEQGVPKSHIAQKLNKDRETIRIWLGGIQSLGLEVFLEKYLNAKKAKRTPRKVDPSLKRLIWTIREREFDCCGQKIQYFLKLDHNIDLSVAKIYEILAEKYVIKSKWSKNIKRGDLPKATKPRQIIQMDSIDFGGVFAFTAVDIFSKEADVILKPSLTALDGAEFLNQTMPRRFNGFSDLIQTDGGSEFEAQFKDNVLNFTNTHRIARPYKKNEQSFIESFNKTVRKECLGWIKYQTQDLASLVPVVEAFLSRYHYHRPHISLGMKPPLSN